LLTHGGHVAGTVKVQRNENFGKLVAGYLFPEVRGVVRRAWKGPQSKARKSQRLHSPPPLSIPCAEQIAKRRRAHQEANPDAKVISLGIGDTTEPLPSVIAEALSKAAAGLATREGYSG
jgi:LL-diaminopimelate aminotransferase